MKFYILHFLCFTVIKILDFIKQKTIYSFIMLWKNEKTYSDSEPPLYSYSNFIVCSVSYFISAVAFVSRHVYFN